MGLGLTKKDWLILAGYIAGTVVMCYALYRWFAIIVGKEVAKALVSAGVVVLV